MRGKSPNSTFPRLKADALPRAGKNKKLRLTIRDGVVVVYYIGFLTRFLLFMNSPVVLVGIGSVKAATKFAQDLELEKRVGGKLVLVADETGSVTQQLGCYQGWLTVDKKHKQRFPTTDLNPYLKLLGMVLGFGSPGTISSVVYGYLGDVADNGPDERNWVVESLLQGTSKGRNPGITADAFNGVSPESSLRPFELATLRLQTGLHVVSNWRTLGPKDGDLYTRMGGTFIFNQKECLWEHFDQGILNYASMEDICWITEAACQGKRWVPPKSIKQRRDEIEEFQGDRNARLAIFEAVKVAELAQQEAEAQAEAQALVNAAEEEARQHMQKQAQEDARIKAEEAKMQAQEMAEEDAKLRAGEDARIAAEQKQASLDAEEEAAQAKASEEARLKLDEALARVQAERAVKQAAEDARVQAEEEEENARLDAEEEAARVEVKALEAESVLKARQEAAVPKTVAKAEPWPIEAVQRKILEARLRDVQKQLIALSSTDSPPPTLAPEQPMKMPLPVETVDVAPASSPEQTMWPMVGLHQRLLEARLKMERNGKEVPAPVEEKFTEEALSEAAEQTRQLAEAYGDKSMSSKKKQKPNLSLRTDQAKGFGKASKD
jgi:hypothetical protein